MSSSKYLSNHCAVRVVVACLHRFQGTCWSKCPELWLVRAHGSATHSPVNFTMFCLAVWSLASLTSYMLSSSAYCHLS